MPVPSIVKHLSQAGSCHSHAQRIGTANIYHLLVVARLKCYTAR